MFVRIDPASGEPSPISFEMMRDRLRTSYPVADDLPAAVRQRLNTAIDLLALAYEQFNQDRPHLFGPLTNTAITTALLALELRLRDYFPRTRRTLGQLIPDALSAGLIPEHHRPIWTELQRNRNQLTHGDADAPLYGVDASTIVGTIVDTIAGMPDPATP